VRIGFLADKIPYKSRRGWGVYSYQLLRALFEIDRSNQYRCFYNFLRKGDAGSVVKGDPTRVKNRVWRLPGRFMDLVWDNWRVLPAEFFLGAVDLIHVPYELLPPVRTARSIVTVHDVTFLRHPELLEPGFVERFTRRIGHVVEHADRILADSDNTMNELIELAAAPPEKIQVIPLGVDPCFRPLEDQSDVAEALDRLGVSRPYILFVGAADGDKNLRRLASAFQRLRSRIPELSLVFAGRDDWGYPRLMAELKETGEDGGIVLTGFVPQEDLPLLYGGAELLALPSLHEGFGLPVLEAMACGTAVVAADAASLPQVVGDAGVLVDPHSVDAIEGGLELLLLDDAQRAHFVTRGLHRAAAHTWTATAEKVLAVYQEMGP